MTDRSPSKPASSPLVSGLVLIGFLALTLGVGYLGRIATETSIRDWYPTLSKPALTPPDIVFPIVWTSLFVLMAVAAWLVWRQAGSLAAARRAFTLYGVQLALNLLWSVLFFGLQSPLGAGIEIFVLIAAIALTAMAFQRHSSAAAWLMAPYLAWVGFASYLNISIILLN